MIDIVEDRDQRAAPDQEADQQRPMAAEGDGGGGQQGGGEQGIGADAAQ
jgi:hypothetical protein